MWERRYGLLEPQRTEGGFRLYSPADEERVRQMQRGIADGLPASLAAQRIDLRSDNERQIFAGVSPPVIVRQLGDALGRFDESTANAILDGALAGLSLATVLDAVLLPYLQDLGSRWERGEISIGQEHFATSIVRGRLLGLARGWGAGSGPRALLACPPGELHDLGLICFGLTLREHGWRIVLLGPNTPIETIRETAHGLGPAVVVVSSMSTRAFEVVLDDLRALGASHRLMVAGPGATPGLADRVHGIYLADAPTVAATRVIENVSGTSS